ncbi:DNA helicase [Tanacetum coccineum]
MLEAVASYDLWIWLSFFGVAGANNDLTVLNNSLLFDDILDDISLVVPFRVNGVTFEKGYYIADGIYPRWTTFVKSFRVARYEKSAIFKRRQESARKEVERALGVLQGRRHIISQSARAWAVNKLRRTTIAYILCLCIIYRCPYLGGVATPGLWLQPWRVCRIASIFAILFSNVDECVKWKDGRERESLASATSIGSHFHRLTLLLESSWLEMDVRFPFPCTDSFDITYQLRNRGNGSRNPQQPSDVRIVKNDGSVGRRMSTKCHDVVPTTMVPVSRIFDRFSNMCFNNVGSDCMSQTDNWNHDGDHQIRTATVENAALITDEVSNSNIHKRGCLHNMSTPSSIEETVQPETIRARDILGYTVSSSRMATMNHAYLCMDVTNCIIRPQIINFPHTNADIAHCRILHSEAPAINDCSTLGTEKTQSISQSQFLQTRMYNQSSSSRNVPRRSQTQGDTTSYMDLGDCNQECRHCGCLFWYNERLKGNDYGGRAEYHLCCGGGKIYMPPMPDLPVFIQQLLTNSHFMNHVRAYNQMFSMTSFGAKIDDSINRGRGPYVFKDEVANRMRNFQGRDEDTLNPEIVKGLYDVVSRGDRKGIQAGSKIMLPRTFTEGPRYMYSHYLDALAICRSLGNPHFLYTIEFQKRGLPHCHTLLWFDSSSKIRNAVEIDEYISAEIPDPVEDPKGYKVVTELMMHGPCGVANSSASCTENGVCKKKFPKKYNETTFFYVNGHTHYRRRQTEVHFMKGESRSIGDTSTSTGKKDIQVDEIQNYVDGRFVCPFEACWRIFEFPIHCREPAVQMLNVHLENTQRVTFRERDRLDIIVNMPEKKKKTLTECWRRRVMRTKKSLGRLTYVHPNSGELFYFRMLLSHRKGCKSPTEVRTVNGYVFPTYRAACETLGLLGDDKEWDIALDDSIAAMKDDIPAKVSEATGILNYYVNTPELQGYILYELEAILNGFGKSVKDFGLPPPPEHLLKDLRNKLLMEERNYKRDLLMQDAAHFLPQDEAPMNDKRCFEALDRTLRDLMNASEIVFGGKIVVLGGDFRQTLPVKKSYEERERFEFFAKWLLDVGNGEIGKPDENNDERSQFHNNIVLPPEKAIVCPKNDTADVVNAKILSTVKSAAKTYLSRDEAIPMGGETSETKLLYPIEYLNTLTFLGFPPHELQLKVGSPIMLLRNETDIRQKDEKQSQKRQNRARNGRA